MIFYVIIHNVMGDILCYYTQCNVVIVYVIIHDVMGDILCYYTYVMYDIWCYYIDIDEIPWFPS